MLLETACQTVREHGAGTYRICSRDGRRATRRLFCNPGTTLLCEFLPRKRRKGTPISPAEISLWNTLAKMKTSSRTQSSFDIFRHNFVLIERYTTSSGLWPSKCASAKRFLANPTSELRAFYDHLTMDPEKRHKDWTAWYEKGEKEAVRLGANAFSIDELCSLCRRGGIKSIPYPHKEHDTAYMAAAIRKMIDQKSPHSGMPLEQSYEGLSWTGPRYDHDARVRWDNSSDEPRGWYDEEYHGCGNGYYWIMLDASHAMFIEKD